jgi:uncharacterized membrane protein
VETLPRRRASTLTGTIMSWAMRFRARQYLKGSLWYWPLAGAIMGPLLAVGTRQADASAAVPTAWQYPPLTASTVLTTIVGATVGLTGFVVTGLVAQLALAVISTVTRAAESRAAANQNSPGHNTLTVTSTRAGSVQAINVGGLVAWASRHDCQLVIRAVVGDAVTTGQPLIDVHGDVPASAGWRLRQQVALGAERTIDQDAAFAIRIIADIAVKALSAATGKASAARPSHTTPPEGRSAPGNGVPPAR